ncbi:MAG: cupin domain-containing protein [Acetobacteraceae bacterium]
MLANTAEYSFEKLIAPVGLDAFFQEYYEKKPLILQRQEPDYFDGLASLDMVDHYLTTTQPRHPAVALVRNDQPAKTEDFTGTDRRIDPTSVFRHFAEGWTVVLTQMQSNFPALASLCRAAEGQFSGQFKTNLYMTPAGAQGFAPHWDTHDVFVLQIHGSKVWTLYDTQLELPLRGQARDKVKDKAGAVSQEFTLHAGDMLYCPRGLIHAAHSTDESSLHITCGLMARTWADLIPGIRRQPRAEAPGAAQEPAAGLRQGRFRTRRAYEPEFRALMGIVQKHAPLKPIFDLMADQFLTTRTPAGDRPDAADGDAGQACAHHPRGRAARPGVAPREGRREHHPDLPQRRHHAAGLHRGRAAACAERGGLCAGGFAGGAG